MRPAVEPTLTITPSPLAISAGSSAWVTCISPITLTSNIRRQSSLSASATGAAPKAPPASLTSTFSVPPTAAASAATDFSSVTSQTTGVPPISAARASMRSARRAAQNTWKPASASILAVAAPMPLLAPVTTAVRSEGDGWTGLWLMAAIVVAHCLVVSPTSLARVAGILGGLCWIGRALLDDGDGPTSLIDGLHYAGLALLVIALLGIGAGLVSGLVALRVVVALCLVALAAAVVSFLHQQYSDRVVDGILGGLMVVYCVIGLLVRRSRPPDDDARDPHRSRGAHAA